MVDLEPFKVAVAVVLVEMEPLPILFLGVELDLVDLVLI
jgi:hypothetical protein